MTASFVGEDYLEVRGLTVDFDGFKAIQGVDITLMQGRLHFLIGPNGAGKTTLVDALTGLVQATGDATFRNHNLLEMKAFQIVRLGISRTFQHMYLNESMTVLENVLIGAASQFRGGVLRRYARPYTSLREEADSRHQAMASLERCGIGDIALRPVAGLPLGVRRRIDLARALVRTPKLLLIDEPASGLANYERALVRDLISIAQTSDNVAVIWIEHDLELVVSAATRVVVLHHGRVAAEGSPRSEQERKRLIDAYLIGNIPPTQGG